MNKTAVKILADDWHSAGVHEGDTLLVHSSISRTLKRISSMGIQPHPDIIIESFLEVLGDSGTLLLPLFNFDFTKGVAFDIRNSPSHMGSLTEAGRLWPNAIRTGHPIYSFAAIGKNSLLFQNLKNYSGYGEDSPFGILHRIGGKIGIIDLPDQNSMTYYHYIEESLNVSYRYHKKFTGSYTDEQGNTSIQTFGLFVRNLELGILTHVNPMGEILWQKGLYTGFRPNVDCGLRVISSKHIYAEVADVIQQGKAKGLLYDLQ